MAQAMRFCITVTDRAGPAENAARQTRLSYVALLRFISLMLIVMTMIRERTESRHGNQR